METVVATTLVGLLWGFAVANPVAAVAGLGLVAFSGYTLGSAMFSTSQPAPSTPPASAAPASPEDVAEIIAEPARTHTLHDNMTFNYKQRAMNRTKPLSNMLSNHFLYYPAPSNLNYSWGFGAINGLPFALPVRGLGPRPLPAYTALNVRGLHTSALANTPSGKVPSPATSSGGSAAPATASSGGIAAVDIAVPPFFACTPPLKTRGLYTNAYLAHASSGKDPSPALSSGGSAAPATASSGGIAAVDIAVPPLSAYRHLLNKRIKHPGLYDREAKGLLGWLRNLRRPRPTEPYPWEITGRVVTLADTHIWITDVDLATHGTKIYFVSMTAAPTVCGTVVKTAPRLRLVEVPRGHTVRMPDFVTMVRPYDYVEPPAADPPAT